MGRLWSAEDIEYLEDNWGYKPVQAIAKKLNRTSNAIYRKACNMGLPNFYNVERIPLMQLSKMTGLNSRKLHKWISLGLPCKKLKLGDVRTAYMFDIIEFIDWIEDYQDEFTTTKFNFDLLPTVPRWLEKKRIADAVGESELGHNVRYKNYSMSELTRLYHMHKKGMNYKEIAKVEGKHPTTISKLFGRMRKHELFGK